MVRSGDLGGHLQNTWSFCPAQPIHLFGKCSLRNVRTGRCQCGGAPSCWKRWSCLSAASCGINQLVSISGYLRPVTVCPSKMNGPYTVCFETAQNTLSFGESRSTPRVACGFSLPHTSHCTCWPFHLSWMSSHHWKWSLPAGRRHFPLTLGDSRKMHVAFPCLPVVSFGLIAACKGVTASVCVRSCLPCFAGPLTLG